jgi:hypothetical protein
MATIYHYLTCVVSTSMELGFCIYSYWKFMTECAIEELEFLFDAKWKNRMLPQLVYANKKNKKEDTFFPLQNFMMRLGLKMRQDSQNIRNYITSGSCYVKFLLCFQKYSGEERERQKNSFKISRAKQTGLVIDLIMTISLGR